MHQCQSPAPPSLPTVPSAHRPYSLPASPPTPPRSHSFSLPSPSAKTGERIERGDAVAAINGTRAAADTVVAALRGPDTIGSPVAVSLYKGGPGGRRAAFALRRAGMRGVSRVARCCVGLAEVLMTMISSLRCYHHRLIIIIMTMIIMFTGCRASRAAASALPRSARHIKGCDSRINNAAWNCIACCC